MIKILATADLHISEPYSAQLQILKDIVYKEQPDVVLIAGDIHDYRAINPYSDLGRISSDIDIIFCLGNHEFAYRSVRDTLDMYRNFNKPSNIHCLDICNYVDVQDVRFVGNVLWYDGSLSSRPDVEDKLRNIEYSWLDESIVGFDPVFENGRCIKQIKGALSNYEGKSVLLTHTVPHYKLNKFSETDPNGVYNIYSGVKNLFDSHGIYPDIAICGHTHRPVTYKHKDIKCSNIGNDYHFRSKELIYDIYEL